MDSKEENIEDIERSASIVVKAANGKEYQTLFWVPMLNNTANQATELIHEMLGMIEDFHKENQVPHHSDPNSSPRKSFAPKKHEAPKRREQILGEIVDSEPVNTIVDFVMKSDSTRFVLLSVLKSHFLFKQLGDYELDNVVDVMQALYVSEGDVIIQQGDSGDLFYILEEGRCEIIIDDNSLGFQDAGTSFGDLALMYNCPRAATIRAAGECTLWTLDRVFFRQATVSSSSHQSDMLSQFLSKIKLFEAIGGQKLTQLARALAKQSFDDGQYIIKQGDIGDKFYVLFSGRVRVSIKDDLGEEKHLLYLEKGEVFGERALLKKEPRKANVIADGFVETYYLGSVDFYAMLGGFVEKFNHLNEFRIIRTAPIFRPLTDQSLKSFVTQFEYHRISTQNYRHLCGADEIYLILDGQWQSKDGSKCFHAEGAMEVGGLNENAAEIADALVLTSDEGILASFSREKLIKHLQEAQSEEPKSEDRDRTFSMLFNEKGSMLQTNELSEASREYQLLTDRRLETRNKRKKETANLAGKLDSLSHVQPLGKGTFGSVYLCQNKNTSDFVALKCLDKKALVSNQFHHYVKREVEALSNFHHPFLAQYYGCITTPRLICFLLEFVSGGELWSYLNLEDENGNPRREVGPFGGLPISHAILYAGNVLLALEHIHELGYVYRDLKPENLLFDKNGYLKVVDFGFAKQVPYFNKTGELKNLTFTLCGTPDYMSRELVLQWGHDKGADYWAFGVLLYELITGETPFCSSKQSKTFEKIVNCDKWLKFPRELSTHGKSLIRRLLNGNPALRLGSLQNGVEDIKSHFFFKEKEPGLDFKNLLEQKVKMPFIPPPFQPGESSGFLAEIQDLDVEFEKNVSVEDDFKSYFADIEDL